MDEQRLDYPLKPTYISSVPIRDVAWKTCREPWTIKTSEGRGSGKSVLAAWHDDDDDDDDIYFKAIFHRTKLYNVNKETKCFIHDKN